MVKRAPVFLRAVKNGKGETDVLDQLDDMPKKTEKIYIYKRVGGFTDIHVLMSPRSKSGWYVLANYNWIQEIDGEQYRDNATWQLWVADELLKMEDENGKS
jgi:hypothetical protein